MSSPPSSPGSPLLFVDMKPAKRGGDELDNKFARRMRKPLPCTPPQVPEGAPPSGGMDSSTYFDSEKGIFWQLAWDHSIPGTGTPTFYCRKFSPHGPWVNNDVCYEKAYHAPRAAAH